MVYYTISFSTVLLVLLFREIKDMKTWILLVSLVCLLALVSAFVGMASWHMAYEEATFLGTIKEQKALEAGRTWCKEFVDEILKQQSEQLKHIQEAHKQKKKVNVGVLGLNIYGVHIVKEAIADIVKDNLSNYYYEVVTSLQSNKSLIDEAQELSQLLDVKVFVGPEAESDLQQLIVWARTRPHPRPFVVFITPALIKDDTDINTRDNDSHAVIQMHMPSSASLRATFSLIRNQNISKILAMTSTFDELNDLQVLKGFKSVKVQEVVTGEFASITQTKEALENAVVSNGVSDGKTGLLITKNYMFEQLSQISSNNWLFSFPWFTSVEGILHDPTFKNYEFFSHPNFSLNYALFTGNLVKNKEWHSNVSLRVIESGLYTPFDSNYISVILEPVYDSVIIAMHIGSWLSHEEIALDALSRRISWESSLWAGMSGLLKIQNFERDLSKYLSLQLSRNLSSQILQYPSGIWNVLGDLEI